MSEAFIAASPLLTLEAAVPSCCLGCQQPCRRVLCHVLGGLWTWSLTCLRPGGDRSGSCHTAAAPASDLTCAPTATLSCARCGAIAATLQLPAAAESAGPPSPDGMRLAGIIIVGAFDALPDAVPDGADRGAAKTNPRPLPLDSMPLHDTTAAGVGLKPAGPPNPPTPLTSAAALPASCDGCHLPAELLPDGPDLPSLNPSPEPSPEPAMHYYHGQRSAGDSQHDCAANKNQSQ